MVLNGPGKLYDRQVDAAEPWWEDTLKGKGPDFDTPDPNEGEFKSATDYFGMLLAPERRPKVPYNVPDGALAALYNKISQVKGLEEWAHEWEKVSNVGQTGLNNNHYDDIAEGVLDHITKEYKEIFRQYQVAWISEYLGVTYSFVLLSWHQHQEETGNQPPTPNLDDRMDTIKYLVNVIKPSHSILDANIIKGIIPTYLLRDKPVKPVEPKPVEPKPVEKKEEEKGGSSSSSLWFIVILVMAIILMNSYER